MSEIRDLLIKGSVWLSVSRAIVNALSVLSTIVLARLLTPSDFGLVALATTMLVIISSMTDLSLSAALVRHAAPSRSHFDTAWTLNAIRGLTLGALFAAAGFPAARLYDDPRLVAVMAALGVSVFMSGLTNPRLIMLQRQLVFRQEVVLNVLQKLTGVLASVSVAYLYNSYWALVIGALAMQATNVIGSYTILPFRPRITFLHLKELLSFSIWLTAGQIINTLNWRFDYLLIGKVLGRTSLGYYSVGSNLAIIPTRETTSPLRRVIFPGFSTIQNNRLRLAAAYQRAQSLITAVALPAGIGAALIADPLVRLTMGQKWEPAIFVVQALASVYALQTLGSLVQPLGMAKGETRLLFFRDLQMLLVRIPIIIAGMLLNGLHGVVVARVLTGLMGAFVNMHLVGRFTGLTVLAQLKANARALTSVAVMSAGVAAALPHLPEMEDPTSLAIRIAASIGLAVILYVGATLLLWTMMGKPAGPESEVQRIVRKALAKLRSA